MTALRRVVRRLSGRAPNGRPRLPAPSPATLPQVQAAKRVRAERAAAESRLAVDGFTAALEQAMRGERRP
jgi:hypothetical protein